MDRFYVLLTLLAICSYGFFILYLKGRRQNKKLEFSLEFFENFKAYMESGGDEVKYYTWMIHRSNKMQNQLGVTGIIHSYKPPYQNFAYKNYTVILSMLPDLKHALEDYILRNGVANQYASTIQDTLVRQALF